MFVSLYKFFETRRRALWALFALILALTAALSAKLHFVEDVSSLLPDSKSLRTLNEIASHTQAGEQLIFLVSHKDTTLADADSLIASTTAFTTALRQQYASSIDSIITQPAGSGTEAALAEIISNHLPLFLDAQDYNRIDSLTQPGRIRQTLHSSRQILLSPASVVYKSMVAQDPLGISRLAYSKLSRLQWDTSYSLNEGYLFAKEGKQLTFFLRPKKTAKNDFYKGLERFVDDWQKANPTTHITYFGGPAVAAGNASQLREDTIVTLGATILLLIALTFYYFRKKRTPLLLLVPVIFGALLGLSVMYLVQGSVSVIALGAGAIVLGIAIDYSVHFLSHMRHVSPLETVKDLQQPLTIGSFTTIAAFFSLRLVHTPILRDLGLFAAASLVGAALCTLIFLPHFPLGAKEAHPKKTFFDVLGRWQPERNKWLLWGIVLLTPVMVYFSFRVRFDDDLMHLNYLSPKLAQSQKEVSNASAAALSAVFVIGQGNNDGSALQKLNAATPAIDSLFALGIVRSASNPASLISSPAEADVKLKRWRRYWSVGKLAEVMPDVREAAVAEGFSPGAFSSYADKILRSADTLTAEEGHILHGLFPGGFAVDEKGQHLAIASLRVAPERREAVFKALSGNPDLIVTDRRQGAALMVKVLNNDFNSIAVISTLIVFFTLLISYGRIELAVISFLPMAISWVWILGLMAMLGLKFNIVNIIISTLIFGLGDDYSIFTMDGLIERYKYRGSKLASVRTAVYVSVATVLIGLGVLLLAKHPALRSIAAISVTGMICVLLISQTLQPALFDWLVQRRADKGFQPLTFWSICKSAFAFIYFLFASLIVSFCGIIFTKLWPFGKERGRYLFHCCIRAANWSLIHIMANVKKQQFNRGLADFSKPTIYIANHTSFLDILWLTSLHPKVVLLTNHWVYRSPVFGAVVRMAEYVPVADGAGESLVPLKDLVSRGYSIILFPEGTRSFTDKMGRLHKGAFFLSQNLGLDISPIVLHGIHYTMPKGDWLLKDGTMSLFYHKGIPPSDDHFGSNYLEKAKRWRQWYTAELQQIKDRTETPKYFYKQLVRSFTYKGPTLEWYCRIKTKIERYWERVHSELPREGLIYDLGCGYGFATYLLHWSAPDRHFISVDYDEDKIETASNNYLKNDRLTFLCSDLTALEMQACSGILLYDVLHYLLPEAQQALLEKCADSLLPGGVLIVRDGVVEMKSRIRGTTLSEYFSTRVFRFNKSVNKLHFISAAAMKEFAFSHGLELSVFDETSRTSNLLFLLRKPVAFS